MAKGAPSKLLRCLLAAWLVLAPSAAAAQGAAPKPDEEIVRIRQLILDGQQHEKAGQLDAAINSYLKALDVSEKKYPEEFSTGFILANLGTAHLNKGDYKEAERHLPRAVMILDKNMKGLRAAGGEQANSPFANAVAAIYGKAVVGLLSVYEETKRGAAKDSDAAIEQFRRAVELAEKNLGPGDLVTGLSLDYLGMAYLNKGDYGQAEQHLLRTVRVLDEYLKGLPKTTREQIPALAEHAAATQAKAATALASVYVLEGAKRGAAGDSDAAIEQFRKAAELSEKNLGPDDRITGWSLDHLGAAYVEKGDYAEAERHLLRAVRVLDKARKEARQEGGDANADYANSVTSEYAKAVHDLAVVYDYLGDPSRAEPLYEQALAAREKAHGPDHVYVAESLNFLANVYLTKADYARAAQMFQRALAINEKKFDPEHPRVTTVLGNLAYAYESLGDAAKAEGLLKEAIARAEKRPNPESLSLATYLNNLGTLYSSKNRAEARPMLNRALAMREKLLGPNDPVVAVTINNLGMLDWREGQLKQAEQRFLRALDIHRKASGPAHPDAAHVLSNLALLYVAMGDVKRGVGLLAEGSRHSERNLLVKLATGSEEQKRIYTASIAEGTSAIVSLHLQKAPADEQAARLAMNTILWRKGRVLDVMSGQVAAVIGGRDGESHAAIAKLTAARGQLSSLVWKGAEVDETQYKAKAEALESQIRALEKVISERATASSGVGPGSVSVEAVQAALPADGALVEVVQYRPATFGAGLGAEWGEPRYAAYVLKRAGAPSAVDLGDAAKIDAAVSRLRVALRDPSRDDVRTLARALDDAVMRPVRKLLGDARQVLISPDGALNLLPFAALVDEQNRYLVESHTFTYLTSGRDLLRVRGHAASREGPVVIANPLFENPAAGSPRPAGAGTGARAASAERVGVRFDPLAGTSEESQEVSALLRGARTFTGAQATEAVVKQVKGPSILHIATHGFFYSRRAARTPAAGARSASGFRVLMTENPLLRSGLALSGANNLDGGAGEDGILTALEAAALDLHGTELIALSACETGVGEVHSGEGVYGLRRALVLAGAESQLMSLWKVEDDATRDLMAGFYRKLTAGEGRSESLRQAQLKFLGGNSYSHPAYWAGFIMSGNWGPLQRK